MTAFQVPSNAEFLAESLGFLELCKRHCRCADHFHFVWSACKASNRRRSIYFQQPLVKALLHDRLADTRDVLIAGASDAGILHVLGSIMAGATRFAAVDICRAPIEEITRYAARHDIAVHAWCCALQDMPLTDQYDLIFIHNTLCFVDQQQALGILRHFRKLLRDDAVVVCGMRYEFMEDSDPAWATGSETALLRALVQNTYREYPDIAAMLDPMLQSYARAKHDRERYRYTEPKFLDLVAAAGYTVVDSYEDTLTPEVVLNSLPGKSSIVSKVYRLARIS